MWKKYYHLYENRCFKSEPTGIYRTFPAKARLAKLADYPEAAAEELKGAGFPDLLEAKAGFRSFQHKKDALGFKARLFDWTCGTIITVLTIVAVALVILGIMKLFELIR